MAALTVHVGVGWGGQQPVGGLARCPGPHAHAAKLPPPLRSAGGLHQVGADLLHQDTRNLKPLTCLLKPEHAD